MANNLGEWGKSASFRKDNTTYLLQLYEGDKLYPVFGAKPLAEGPGYALVEGLSFPPGKEIPSGRNDAGL